MFDVSCGNHWTEGLNKRYTPVDVQQMSAALFAQELDKRDVILGPTKVGVGRGLVTTRSFRENEKIMDLTALWFDSVSALNEFLSQSGGGAFSDRVVVISNVLRSGAPQDLYAVLVGLGQYVNHYSGLRKSANAMIQLKPSLGFNRGSLHLVASNRNNSGIGGGGEICINYGVQFDLQTPCDTPSKRIRGALDNIFDQQSGQHPKLPDPPTPAPPPSDPSRDPPAPGPVPKPPTPPAPQPTPKPEEGNGSAPPGTTPPEVSLGALTTPSADIVVGGGQIILKSKSIANKKVPPGTLLWQTTAGQITSKVPDGMGGHVVYDLQPKSQVWSIAEQKLMKLDLLAKHHYPKLQSVWGFGSLAHPGTISKQLTADKKRAFVVDVAVADIFGAAFAAVGGEKKSVAWAFMLKHDAGKEALVPHGIALVTTVQLNLKPGDNVLP